MATTRTAVRDDVLALLVAAAGTLGNPLYGFVCESSRLDPLPDGDTPEATDEAFAALGPTLLVYAPGRVDTPQASYGMTYLVDKSLTINVDGYIKGATSAAVETAMDELEEAMTTTILGNQTWLDSLAEHPTVQWTYLANAKGGRLRGLVMLSIQCRVTTEVP